MSQKWFRRAGRKTPARRILPAPQEASRGVLALLFDALGRGEDSVVSDTGVGSFIDPRVGRGSPVTEGGHGRRALRAGKRVFYATPVGLFRLTERGVQLESVFPGIDVRRDVLEVTAAKIVLPPSGEVAVAPSSTLTGEAFVLPASA